MNPADHALIQRCLAKDPKAWDEFVERYSHLIYDAVIRTFERYGHPRQMDVVADLHNDVFILIIEDECHVLRKFEGRNGCQLGHYLRTVAVRRTVDFLRRIRPTVSLDEDPEEVSRGFEHIPALCSNPDGAEILINQEQQEILKRFILRLSRSDQEFFRWVMTEGMAPEKAAQMLGISMDYFYVRKKRLIDKLRSMAAEERMAEEEGLT